jgi:hypothetical protein
MTMGRTTSPIWRWWQALATAALLVSGAGLVGCKAHRVEYHKRPAFYDRAALGKLPDEVVLEDGTVIKYQPVQGQSSFGRAGDDRRKPFQIREEHEDALGKKHVTLRALLPEHVLGNTLTCLRNQEYELLYEQMTAQCVKDQCELEEGGVESFIEALRRNRHDLVATLTRMVAGLPHEEVAIINMGGGVTRCKLRSQISEPFKFKSVDVIKEGSAMKLLWIQ